MVMDGTWILCISNVIKGNNRFAGCVYFKYLYIILQVILRGFFCVFVRIKVNRFKVTVAVERLNHY